jgi:hypothetical protein
MSEPASRVATRSTGPLPDGPLAPATTKRRGTTPPTRCHGDGMPLHGGIPASESAPTSAA